MKIIKVKREDLKIYYKHPQRGFKINSSGSDSSANLIPIVELLNRVFYDANSKATDNIDIS